MSDSQIRDLIVNAIKNKKLAVLKELFETIPTIDIAEAMDDIENVSTLLYPFRTISTEYTGELFAELSSETQEKIINAFSDKDLIKLLEASFADDVVDSLQELPANIVHRILQVAPLDLRKDINQLLNYKDNTAGSIMTTEFIEMHNDITVKEAIAKIRKIGRDAETIYTIFVRDKKRTFVGTVSLDDLIFAKEDELIEDIMDRDFVSCQANDDQEEVANMFKRYDLNAMAVVNKENKIIGIITIDDVVDIIVEEANEDIAKLNNVSNIDTPYLKTPILKLVWKCVPWIMILMILQIGSAAITSHFDAAIASFAVLAVFSPLILDAGGNSGGQTTTMIVRSLAMDEFEKGDFKRVVWKELRVSLIIAAIIGVFAFGLTYLEMTIGIVSIDTSAITVSYFANNLPVTRLLVSGLVGSTLMLTMIISRMIGACLPFLAKKLKLDPAVVCGPFTTTIVDIVSLLTYFIIWTELISRILGIGA